MGVLASTSFQCGFVEKPEGLNIFISPSTLVFNTATPVNQRVLVDVYKGNKKLDYSKEEYGCSSLGSNSELTNGLVWGFGVASDGGFYYNFIYRGAEVNMTIPFVVTVDGVGYNCALSVQTVKNGTDGSGSNGKNGVFIPPLMLWQDYPSGYYFEAGVPGTDTRLDMVGVKNADGDIIPYYCTESHTKSSSYIPGTDTTKWSAADAGVYKCVATELMLAANARIDFLSGQSIHVGNGSEVCGYFGAPFASGAMLFTGGKDEGAATFVVYNNGSARWGDANGQRIEMDPTAKRMNVYDSSGRLCAIHSGDTLDYSKVGQETGNGSSATAAASAMGQTLSGATSKIVDLTSGTAPSRDGTLKVTVPKFSIDCTGNLANSDTVMSSWKAELYLQVEVGGVIKASPLLLYVANDKTTASSLATQTINVNVPAGKAYNVKLKYVSNLASGGTSKFTANGSASISLEVANNVCHYGKNGWYISSSNQNYAYFILDSNGKLHAKIMSGGVVKLNTD